MKEKTHFGRTLQWAGEKLRTFIIVLRAAIVNLPPRKCEVCGERLHRDQLTADVRVAHLGRTVRVHRFCSAWERNRRLATAAPWN